MRTLINSPDVSFVRHVIDFGYSLDYENDGTTLLHYAAANKNVEIVRFFIEQGLDVNAAENLAKQSRLAQKTNGGSSC